MEGGGEKAVQSLPAVVPARRDEGGSKVGGGDASVGGPKGSKEGTGTPKGSNVKQGEIGKPKAVWWCPPNSRV